MKILFLAHRIPFPPNKGEKIRCFHELEFLAARHTIDLFCFADSEEDARGRVELEKLCRLVFVETLPRREGLYRAVRSLLSDTPASIAYYNSSSFREAVHKQLAQEKYDGIFVYCSSMGQFVPSPAPARTIIDFVDADSAKWTQYAAASSFPLSRLYKREGRLLARYERMLFREFSTSIVATTQEISDLGGGACLDVEVVRNGVNLPRLKDEASLPEQIRNARPYVLFVGTMNYRPNVDAVEYFAKDIFPLVRQTHPSLRFLIVGRDPTAEVRHLSQLPGVMVTGSVPDTWDYVAGADVVVAPFRISQGIQNKILEALVAGVPLVSTSRPVAALDGIGSHTVLVGDSPESFAAAVRTALDEPAIRRRSTATAQQLQEQLRWDRTLTRLEDLMELNFQKSGDAVAPIAVR